VGDLLLIIILLQRMVGQVSALQSWSRQTISVIPSYDIVQTMNRQLIEQGEPESRVSLDYNPLQRIELHNLHYAYPNNHTPAVQDVSFTIDKGEMVAIVGPSGSGKTTLIDLLTGLIPPQTGQLLVNGQSLRESDLKTWRRRVSYVPQTSIIFAGSIRENITRFASDDKVWSLDKALAVSCADEFISELESGADTVIRERGSNLSGGQCQRLAIARALYCAPEVLVLDEATSALDAGTERLLWKRLRENLGEMTVIFITHRLSNLQFADKVVVMNDGRAETVGEPSEVECSSPTLAVLLNAQPD
jgi:ABC-type multidrug transport system fused ATPase/permease subunit